MHVWLLVVLLLILGTQGLGTGLKGAIKQRTLEMAKDFYLPIIMRSIGELRMPDITGSIWIPIPPFFFPVRLDYRVHNIHASLGSLNPSEVRLYLRPNSNRIGISVNGISAAGEARLDWNVGPFNDGCNGHLRIHGVGTSFDVIVGVDGSGRPAASIDGLSVGVGNDNVDVWFDGHILQDLINFVVNIFKPMIVPFFKDLIDSNAPGPINNALHDFIGAFNLWVDIGPNLALSWRLTKTPWINADYLCVSLAGYIYLKSKPEPPTYEPLPTPDYNPNSQKGAQLFVTDYTLRSGIDAAFQSGLLTIEYSLNVDKYDVTLACEALTSPVLTLDSAVQVTDKGKCRIKAKDRTNGQILTFTATADTLFLTKEYVKDQTLFFSIQRIELSNMEIDNPNQHDVKWFEKGINFILAEAAKAINLILGERGIRLPYIARLEYSDIEEHPRRGYIETFVTPQLKGPFPTHF